MKKIFVIAGEASGDLHGSNLIKNLKTFSKEPLEIYGVGGDRIKNTGALEFFDLAHFHVTGMTEAIRRYPQYKKAGKIILKKIEKTKPDLVVLIDNPGFNLFLAGKIHRLGIPSVYYIAPQVWAWAPKRILKIKRTIKKVLVVFEFEKKIYEDQGIPVAWVGHPLKDLIEQNKDIKRVREKLVLGKSGPLISLLPGSRKGELKMLLSIFLKAGQVLLKKFPDAVFLLIKSPTLPKSFYERVLKKSPVPVSLVEEDAYSAIRSSDLAIVCSGTATLECSILGTPMVISNRGSLLTYIAAKSLIRVPYLGLPNILLGKKRIPELLQYDATPEKIAAAGTEILQNESVRHTMKEDLKKASEKVGEGGANKKAAEEILKVLSGEN